MICPSVCGQKTHLKCRCASLPVGTDVAMNHAHQAFPIGPVLTNPHTRYADMWDQSEVSYKWKVLGFPLIFLTSFPLPPPAASIRRPLSSDPPPSHLHQAPTRATHQGQGCRLGGPSRARARTRSRRPIRSQPPHQDKDCSYAQMTMEIILLLDKNSSEKTCAAR